MKTIFTTEELRMTIEMIRSTQVNQYAETEYHVRRVLDYIEDYIEESEHVGIYESDYDDLNIWLNILIKEDKYIISKERCVEDFNDAWRAVTNTNCWLNLNVE